MRGKTLVIQELTRTSKVVSDETLYFEPGVNVIAGQPNTGKSKWLSMFNYLMGDDQRTPEDAFDNLAEKYDSISALIQIGDEVVKFERNWKKPGLKSKVLVNDEIIPAKMFSQMLLKRLEIPILSLPKGNPYSDATWPHLSWRMLLRHIYRQQRFWGDFAVKQPEGEQHACLMQFLGIAENLYSKEYSELVTKQKQIFKLKNEKDVFLNVLNETYKNLIAANDLQVSITPQSVDRAIEKLQTEIEGYQRERDVILKNALRPATSSSNNDYDEVQTQRFEAAGAQLAEQQSKKEEIRSQLLHVENRLHELNAYKTNVSNELSKIARARSAGQLMADLKVTHCPACDQELENLKVDAGTCFLCHRKLPNDNNHGSQESKRIDFEMEQLKTEAQEIDELIQELQNKKNVLLSAKERIGEDIVRIENQLRPARKAIASAFPPDITILDMNIGRLQERIRQLNGVKSTLELRKKMSQNIDDIQEEIAELEGQVSQLSQKVHFEQANDLLSDGMNTYLNELVSENTGVWTQGRVEWHFRKRDFKVFVDNSKWVSKLGGTLTLYFFLAYHYALLSLTPQKNCHYPGLSIIDLPATLEDGSTIRDHENFILEPYIKLLSSPEMKNCQAIVAGAAFENLQNANLIKFSRVWK